MKTITKKQIKNALNWEKNSGAVATTDSLINKILDYKQKCDCFHYFDELTTQKDMINIIYDEIN